MKERGADESRATSPVANRLIEGASPARRLRRHEQDSDVGVELGTREGVRQERKEGPEAAGQFPWKKRRVRID